MLHAVLFILRLESRTNFKSHFFIFLRGLKSTEGYVDDFWISHYKRIKDWYQAQDHSNDVIISASPEFLLRSAFIRLKARHLIATLMDPQTGSIEGENCRGEEKVKRLKQKIKDPSIRRAYTDHRSDSPILDLAQEKYLVKRHKITRLI
jgi:phosphoserine phosphatase